MIADKLRNMAAEVAKKAGKGAGEVKVSRHFLTCISAQLEAIASQAEHMENLPIIARQQAADDRSSAIVADRAAQVADEQDVEAARHAN